MRIKSTGSKTMDDTGKLKLNIKTKVLNQQQNFDHKMLSNRESGVALILAVGISFILLMLALAFVTTSMIEKKSALNFQYMNTARALAQTAFNRGIADMKLSSLYPKESMHTIVSHSDSPSVEDTPEDRLKFGHNLASELTTIIGSDTVLIIADDYPMNTKYDITDTSSVTWIYMQYPEDNNQLTDNSIFGRIAYVVLPDKGKIDPWAVIDSGLNADTFGKIPPSEFQYGNGISLIDQAGNEVYGRPGRDITELSMASLEYDSDTFYPSYTKAMSVKTCSPVGKVDIGDTGKYKDIEDLFDKLSISQNNDTIRQYFNEVFYINPVPDDEKYWIDKNYDAVRDIKEMHNRFNLTERGKSETETDTYTWEDLTPENFGQVAPELQWIINITDTTKRDQIIANLIDYCDSDTNASAVNEFDPGYVGLERCPYFNEIVLRLDGTITRTGDTEPYSFNFKVTPSINVELVDMYSISNTPSKINIDKLIMSYDIGISDNYIYSASTAVTVDSNVSFDVNATPSASYLSVSCPASILSNCGIDTSISQDDLGVSDVTNLKIRIKIENLNLRLKAADGISLYDYSKVKTDTYGEIFVTSGIDPITKTASITYDFQVADPRQNLLSEEWAQDTSVSNPILGTRNSSFPASFNSSNLDKENSDIDPWQISTAYIRNAPMQSPWELGFIHRGKAFQTINLKKYNAVADGGGFGPRAYAGEYSDGDANILDQIKMTSNLTTQGKINLNTDNQSVLRTLFDHISVGTIPSWSTPDGRNSAMQNPGTGGTAISTIKADELAAEVLNFNGTNGGTPFFTRAQIVNQIANLRNGAYGTQVNDAQQEEIIGKFINLTKVETPDLYTIIAIGQAIKDVGNDTGIIINKNGVDVTVKKGEFDINGDEIVASQKIFGLIKRISDPDKTDTFYIKDIMYLEQ